MFDDLAESEPLPERIYLYSGGRQVERGYVGEGHFGVPRSDEDILDLGPTIDVFVLARRAKAIDTSSPAGLIEVFDPTNPEFVRIRQNSVDPETGCFYGTEVLLFERTTKRLYEYLFASRSTRPLAKDITTYMPLTSGEIEARGLTCKPRAPLGVTFDAKRITRHDRSWYVPELKIARREIDGLPPGEQLAVRVKRFLSPDDSLRHASSQPSHGECPLARLLRGGP